MQIRGIPKESVDEAVGIIGDVHDYKLETLADAERRLCGVARQCTGSVDKITSCQIGVLACCVARRGRGFIGRELYLPMSPRDDKAPMPKVHAPRERIDSVHGGFSTKPALALTTIERHRHQDSFSLRHSSRQFTIEACWRYEFGLSRQKALMIVTFSVLWL